MTDHDSTLTYAEPATKKTLTPDKRKRPSTLQPTRPSTPEQIVVPAKRSSFKKGAADVIDFPESEQTLAKSMRHPSNWTLDGNILVKITSQTLSKEGRREAEVSQYGEAVDHHEADIRVRVDGKMFEELSIIELERHTIDTAAELYPSFDRARAGLKIGRASKRIGKNNNTNAKDYLEKHNITIDNLLRNCVTLTLGVWREKDVENDVQEKTEQGSRQPWCSHKIMQLY